MAIVSVFMACSLSYAGTFYSEYKISGGGLDPNDLKKSGLSVEQLKGMNLDPKELEKNRLISVILRYDDINATYNGACYNQFILEVDSQADTTLKITLHGKMTSKSWFKKDEFTVQPLGSIQVSRNDLPEFLKSAEDGMYSSVSRTIDQLKIENRELSREEKNRELELAEEESLRSKKNINEVLADFEENRRELANDKALYNWGIKVMTNDFGVQIMPKQPWYKRYWYYILGKFGVCATGAYCCTQQK